VRLALGAIDVPVFTRSAAKPFIAAAIVGAGAAVRFGFGPDELAIAAGSHSGEPEHIATVRRMLTAIGAGEDDLRCGFTPPATSPLANNCSGKHAGILALARVLDAPLAGYLEPDHPAQRAILACCERVFGEGLGPDRIGVDGCGIPNVAVSLRAGARGFARLAAPSPDQPDADALRAVRDAMLARPWFVAGTGRFDTDLMLLGRGLVSKAGAEAVEGVGATADGSGLMLKVVDGARRATGPATVELLRRLGQLDSADVDALARHARPPVRNVAGRVVGATIARRAESEPT
jgi:L-asparaginase II